MEGRHHHRKIAAELGGVSRNSIIGKAYRLGLPGRPKPKSERRRGTVASRRLKSAEPPTAPQEQPFEIPEAQRIHNVLDLRDGRCKWPVGDLRKGGFYCGGAAVDGSPYCLAHDILSHRPPR